MTHDPVISHMLSLIEQWQADADERTLFLSCYQMMTSNMLLAIDENEFNDPRWVDHLLHRFADYYFVALEAYDRGAAEVPAVWQSAFDATRSPRPLALQKLLLGVNAHINYDLVLTLVDLLRPEWAALTASQREARYTDHCHVNEIIGRTIDAVQDQVLEPAMPMMDLVDKLFGSLDELVVSRLITGWREQVWDNAVRLLETADPAQQAGILRQVEADALRTALLIYREQEQRDD
jgi:hypothetical protein